MPETHPIVFVVDNDSSVRDALNRLIRSVGLDVDFSARLRSFHDGGGHVRPLVL
jgi:FixJ family two-component response regulator